MALGVQAPPMNAAAVSLLYEKLQVYWSRLSPPGNFYLAPGAHANSATHLVLDDPSGLRIGLKAADRGIQRGTKTERIASGLARRMALPLAPTTHLITRISNGLGVLSNRVLIATEWYQTTEALDKLPPHIAGKVQTAATDFLRCFGEWLAFGLALGTRDRNAGNWICTDDGGSLGMIDLEESLGGEARPEDFRIPLIQFQLLDPLRNEAPRITGGLRDAVEQGLRAVHKRWFSARGLRSGLATHSWCAGYTTTWWIVNEDQFVTDVLTRLLA
jgi:hypothetical protein